MSKPEWGIKRICHSCGARFYDMNRDPIVCPACNTPFDPEASLKTRKRGATAEKAKAEPVAKAAPEEEETAEIEESESEELEDAVEMDGDEEDDGDLIEDTDDLGEDEGDIPGVKDGEEET